MVRVRLYSQGGPVTLEVEDGLDGPFDVAYKDLNRCINL